MITSSSQHHSLIILIHRRSARTECLNLLRLVDRVRDSGLVHDINFARCSSRVPSPIPLSTASFTATTISAASPPTAFVQDFLLNRGRKPYVDAVLHGAQHDRRWKTRL
jgi:hypothetical protein